MQKNVKKFVGLELITGEMSGDKSPGREENIETERKYKKEINSLDQ